jgi:hypothetical protein
MDADFLDAHDRHWNDAKTLFEFACLANADHLYGLAAECGLKRLMIVWGMKTDLNKGGLPFNVEDRVHIMESKKDSVWDRYESYRMGKAAPSYGLPAKNPFSDWDVSQRYANRSEFDESRVKGHEDGARLVRELVKTARREGFLP